MSGVVVIRDEDDEVPDAPEALPTLGGEEGAGEAVPAGVVAGEDNTLVLALRWPAVVRYRKTDGTTREERFGPLVFHRLTGKHLREIIAAGEADAGVVAFGAALRMPLGRARLLWDVMDATDVAAASRVIRFLSGSGQTTGP